MATSKVGETLPGIVAASDLTSSQFLFATLDSAGKAALAGAGAQTVGVLQNKPDTDQAASLWGPGSLSKVVSGAALTPGADLTPDASGKAVVSASGDYIAGKCVIGTAGADELASVWLSMPGRTA